MDEIENSKKEMRERFVFVVTYSPLPILTLFDRLFCLFLNFYFICFIIFPSEKLKNTSYIMKCFFFHRNFF